MNRINIKELIKGQPYMIRNIGCTDSWAIGVFFDLDDVGCWISINEDELQVIEAPLLEGAHIYHLEEIN